MQNKVLHPLYCSVMKCFVSAGLATGLAVAALQAAQPASAPRQTPAAAVAAPAAKPAAAAPAQTVATPGSTVESQNALVKQYCTGCHNERNKARVAELSLADFDAARLDDHAATVEKMIRKLRAGMMPPPGARRPDAEALAAMVTAFEGRLDRAAALKPNPGRRPFQRLNRAEYAAAARDLLAVEVDVDRYLPPDTISHGFDNVADAQNFSPALMEGYLRAASEISRLAVGDRNATATSATYKIGRTASQMRRVDGAPMGTRGGVSVIHTFPADGEYVIKASLHYEPLGGLVGRTSMNVMALKEQVEVSINGERVALLELNTRMSETDPNNGLEIKTPPIHITAGPQRVTAAFIEQLDGPVDDLLMPVENTLADVSVGLGVTMLPHLRDMTVLGPAKVTGVSETPSRSRIFTCRPTTAGEEETCATDIVKKLTTQAFRGAPSAEDLQDAIKFYEQGRRRGGFEAGIRMAVQSILMSPRFLFRIEQAPAGVRTASAWRLTDQDLASRLSFFLWGTAPDEELLKAASWGTLKTTAGLEKQVRRMLADRRSDALATRFGSQWLRLQDLDQIIPDYLLYPQYDDTLRDAMKKETELFFGSIVREDRSVMDLLTADYSFVNERLAKHYGIANVTGEGFQRVALPPYRRGVLGHGSILTLTSNADRTSPVMRGKWVMEVLLGSPPPPPPPDVPLLDEVKSTKDGKFLSTRERMEEHRKNPTCNSCHRVIDPLGLALDNFDPTGAWRIKDNEVPVEVVGDLYDGTTIDGPAGLRDALVRHRDVYLLSFTESLLTYAIGRRVEHTDMPAIRAIVRDSAKQDHRFSAFVLGLVNSPAFRMSGAEPAAPRLTNDAAADKAGRQ